MSPQTFRSTQGALIHALDITQHSADELAEFGRGVVVADSGKQRVVAALAIALKPFPTADFIPETGFLVKRKTKQGIEVVQHMPEIDPEHWDRIL